MQRRVASWHAVALACLLAGCGGGGDETAAQSEGPQAAAPVTMARADAEPAGANCAEGGSRISAGTDSNRNGVLEAAEVASTQFLCAGPQGATGATGSAGAIGATGIAGSAGPSGATSLVRIDSEPAGSHCANGGSQVSVGIDANGNGRLDAAEVSSVGYVCTGSGGAAGAAGPTGTTGATGAAGAPGNNGTDGATSLLGLAPEPAGANCAHGGTRASSGVDSNRNAVLDPGEVTSTSYICAGPPGPGISWIDVTTNTQAAQANKGYLANSTSEVAITLPASLAVGDIVRVTGVGSGGWKILQNAGQSIDTAGLPGNVGPGERWAVRDVSRDWWNVASSSDGLRLVATVTSQQDSYIYTSADGGETWIARDATRDWNSVASSADGSRLIASVNNGTLYVSADYGVTWSPTESARSWRRVASSANGAKLAAVVENGQVYVSSDYGASWQANGAIAGWHGVGMSADGNHIWAGAFSLPIYSTSDGGTTWSSSGPSLNWTMITASADGRRVAATAFFDQIYLSSDYGASWSPTGSAHQWFGIASSADGNRLAATDYGGAIYTSADAGATWQQRQAGNQNWTGIASSADGNRLVAVGYGSRIFLSLGTTRTTAGSGGSLSGGIGAAVELQYLGGGAFAVLAHNDPAGGFVVK